MIVRGTWLPQTDKLFMEGQSTCCLTRPRASAAGVFCCQAKRGLPQ